MIKNSESYIVVLFPPALDLQVVTVATEETDGFKRFMQSASHFNLSVEVKKFSFTPLAALLDAVPRVGIRCRIFYYVIFFVGSGYG